MLAVWYYDMLAVLFPLELSHRRPGEVLRKPIFRNMMQNELCLGCGAHHVSQIEKCDKWCTETFSLKNATSVIDSQLLVPD